MTAAVKPLILIVEDETDIVTLLRYNLEKEGFRVIAAGDGEEALLLAGEQSPNLMLLDWMLPLMSGLEVCRQLRRNPKTRDIPVIMLTARGEEADRVRGLNSGADDYITKPFSQRLLIERIRALLRRDALARGDENDPTQVLLRGDLRLDGARHACMWKNQDVELTVTEFLLLRALAQRPGHVKSRDQLIDAAYGERIYVDDRTIDSHVKRIRKKFRAVDGDFAHIETLYGVGYRYRES